MYSTISYDLIDGVAVITLNRPEVMNALSSALRAELLAAILRARAEARVIVLTGVGRVFCSGQDLLDVDLETLDLEAVLNAEYVPLIRAITESPVPVISAVNGAAVGAMLFADRISAAQAAAWGMIYEAVPDADFATHWRKRAQALSQGPTVA